MKVSVVKNRDKQLMVFHILYRVESKQLSLISGFTQKLTLRMSLKSLMNWQRRKVNSLNTQLC